jgi:hypothetical protein
MADIINITWMPKDMKKRTADLSGLDPDDPKDAAFKPVTKLVYLLYHKNTTSPPPLFLITAQQQFSPLPLSASPPSVLQ